MDKLFCTSCCTAKPADGFVKTPAGRKICSSCVAGIAKNKSAAHLAAVKKATHRLKTTPDKYIDSILKQAHE